MRKIPSLFIRDWNGPSKAPVTRELNSECKWVQDGEGVATRKRDGTACAVINGRLYKRHDCKRGSKWAKNPPADWIACQEPDPVTGHWPHWAPVGDGPEDKYHREAFAQLKNTDSFLRQCTADGTLELCGPHFQTNPEGLEAERFFRHGSEVLDDCPRDFDGLKSYLAEHPMEGVVWHHSDGRMCKIKASDFGIKWPRKVEP